MFLRIILGMSTFGRYGAIGLSVGGTGYFSSLYLIYLMYIHKYTQYTPVLISIAFLALILSGQRTNLFLVLFFIIPYLFSDVFQASNKNNKLFLHMFLVIFFLFVSFFLVIFGEQIMSSFETENFLTRILTTIQDFSDDTVSSDYSVDGRMRSIEAGLDILSETPTGISNCFYDLQFRMLELQFPTFPHSSLLSCLLLWSIPITLYCMYYLILLTIKLLIKRNGYFFVVLYILLIMIVWNGPFLDYPIVFITLFFISLATNSIHKSESLPQIEQMITSNKQNATT